MTDHHLSRRAASAALLAAFGAPELAVRRAAAQDATPTADTDGTDDTDDDRAISGGWVAIRTYALKPGTDRAEMIADTEDGLLPIMTKLDGFVAFYVLRPDDLTWTAVTVWRDKDASDAGVGPIREWIAATVADNLEGPPESFEGAVDLVAFAGRD